jgi:hypothetical protein
MSSTSKSSLDHDWELATARTSSSTHPTVTSDDELETISLPADPSELGDDTWEGIDDDNESVSSPLETSQQAANHEMTPLQSQQVLNAEDDEDEDAEAPEADLTMSEVGPSENSGTDSTFSFHFPDPLEASREYSIYPEAPVDGSEPGESDAETNSIAETDLVAPGLSTSISIGALERSATLVQPRSSSNSTQIVVATSISSRFAFAAYVSYPLECYKSRKMLTWMWFGSGIALTAVAIACVAMPGVYHRGELSRSDSTIRIQTMPYTMVPTKLVTKPHGVDQESPVLALATISPAPPIEAPIEIPTLSSFSDSRSREPPSPPPGSIVASPLSTALVLPSNHTSLSLNRITLVTSSLSTTYNSFSKVILRDLHDVLHIIDELLLFLRSHTIADTVEYSSRSIVDFIVQKLADRHERAKINARKLTSKGMELMREWRLQR